MNHEDPMLNWTVDEWYWFWLTTGCNLQVFSGNSYFCVMVIIVKNDDYPNDELDLSNVKCGLDQIRLTVFETCSIVEVKI